MPWAAAKIILLNGPFAVGRTTAARLLVQMLPDVLLYDPERVAAIMRAVPRPLQTAGDYQDRRRPPPPVVLGARLPLVRRRMREIPVAWFPFAALV